MSERLTKNDLADKLFRPRRLYITSEDVKDYGDAGVCKVTLQEAIVPTEGFKLAYGVKSFGYQASATTISKRQRNNALMFRLSYDTPAYTYDGENFVATAVESKTSIFKIYIPDGFYATLDDLFTILNDIDLFRIPSMILKNVLDDGSSRRTQLANDPNMVCIYLFWSKTNYGFKIDARLGFDDDESTVLNDYPGTLVAKQVNYTPKRLDIVPGDNETENLYNLLFSNTSAAEDTPPNIPSYETGSGNPPDIVSLVVYSCNMSFGTTSTNVNVDDDFEWYWSCQLQAEDEEFDTELREYEDYTSNDIGILDTKGYNNSPLKIYFSPRLFPIYVDVATSLETANLTIQGSASNLLLRHFPVGADRGSQSYFQAWDQPVIHHTQSARNTIDAITVEISSENDIWNFFNLIFYLEIVFYEVAEEEELPTYASDMFEVPTDDPMTSELQAYNRSFTNPFPIHSTGTSHGTLKVGSSRSGYHKRRR
jgi:hypothetical protein